MRRKNMKNIKPVEIKFEELVKLKDKLDNLTEKCVKKLDFNPASHSAIKALNDKDRALYAFISALKVYYDSPKLSNEELFARFESEREYQEGESNKSYEEILLCHSVNNSFYDNGLDFDDEMEKEEEMLIKQGN